MLHTVFEKYEELMDVKKCKSYKELNIIKVNSNTFADFCRDAVKALEANDFRVGICFGDTQVQKIDDDESDNRGGAVAPVYKSREIFFTDVEFIARCLDRTKNHAVISEEKTEDNAECAAI